ncbi:hypothetical protein PPSIR1_03828 [Plesiocystis pacifica SIR-1]|uniref:STAS/SEC14 domain-containing protein n=2 Tax=Plesiocystis pacifica TaxID=191768 RepID=A6G4C4_9BACT|nr:hypothetical protein PPSIR1_03828 [Plesiocystis pacifica SIR-1]
MYMDQVPGVAVVIVHTDEPPSDEDWDAHLELLVSLAGAVDRVLVYTGGAGPSVAQRRRTNEAFVRAGGTGVSAILTPSRMVRGIVKAFSWAMQGQMRAFAPSEFRRAVDFLGVPADDIAPVRALLDALLERAGQAPLPPE